MEGNLNWIKRNVELGIAKLFLSASACTDSRLKAKDILNYPEQKILVVVTSGIGNMILFVPTLHELRQKFPRSHIALLVEPRGTKEILQGCPYINRVIVKEFGNRIQRWKLVRDLHKQKYGMVIVSFTSQNFDNVFLSSLTGAPVRIGYEVEGYGSFFTHRIQLAQGKHEVECNLDSLRAIGLSLPEERKNLELWLTQQERENAAKIVQTLAGQGNALVGFHPGSYPDLAYKRWPMAKFAKLGEALVEKYHAQILFFGSKEEVEISKQISKLMRNKPVVLTGELSLRESVAVIERCALFISNDSGLMHVAAALGVPVVGIFGPTIASKNAPYGEEGKCVVVTKGLSCSPCYEMFREFHCDTLKCLETIAVEDVLGVIEEKFLSFLENSYDLERGMH